MEQEDSTENTLRLQSCLQKFIDHVDALKFEDDPSGDGYTREFRGIRDEGIRDRENSTYPAEEGRKQFNIKKNRYKDILPFDETRVTLDEIPGEEGSDYINANFVQDQYGAKCYIASQGPVPPTVYDFWRMIMQYKVKVVAMACRLVEMGKKKCEQYWPDELDVTSEFRDISVTLLSQDDIGEHCTKRVMRASKAGCDSLTVTQFHYTGWPDHDIPNDFDVILEMMAEMREIKSKDTERAPMVIHCSAGCGRTGTMVAIDFVWDLLKSGNMDDEFSLYDIVKLMRTQRQSMIQAPEQYMMAHVTVKTLFQMHLDLMEDHTYGNIGFNVDGDSDEKLDGSASETGSEASSGLYGSARKRSVMAQDIAKTVQNVTHVLTADELLTPTNPTVSDPPGLPKPLTPTVAVYEVHTEPVVSPSGKEPKNQIADSDNKDTKTFKVDNIANIPTYGNAIDQRYLHNISKKDFPEKKLSFISNEARQKDIEAKKAMFEKPEISEKPALEPLKSSDKTRSLMSPSVKEKNNNHPGSNAKPAVSTERPVLQRVESKQMGNKHVTVLSVGGGGAPRPPLGKTVSAPVERNTAEQNNGPRSKTLPKGNPIPETPQSSVPPENQPSQRPSVYSSPGNSQFYSSLSNYSSAVPKTDTSTVQGDPYSSIASYSSGNGIQKNQYSYAAVKENPRDVTASKPTGETTAGVYSYADEPALTADILYSAVEKPTQYKKTMNGTVSDAVYEPVTIGTASDKAAPALPNRGYLGEDNENQSERSGADGIKRLSGAGDTSTLGKKAQLTSAIKKVFGKGTNTNTNDNVVPSDIPGFMIKLGKKPRGQREQPSAWKKK